MAAGAAVDGHLAGDIRCHSIVAAGHTRTEQYKNYHFTHSQYENRNNDLHFIGSDFNSLNVNIQKFVRRA